MKKSTGYSVKEIMERRFNDVDGHLAEIKKDGKETKEQVVLQNGRIRKLEDWSTEAQKVIEGTTTIASNTLTNYKLDKARIWIAFWVATSLLTLLGGTIVTLSIMAINAKIKTSIRESLAGYGFEVTK